MVIGSEESFVTEVSLDAGIANSSGRVGAGLSGYKTIATEIKIAA
jgi:hypothetical protein